MKYARLLDIPASPALRAKLNPKAKKAAIAYAAAACMLLSPLFTSFAHADTNTNPATIILADELATLATTGSNATAMTSGSNVTPDFLISHATAKDLAAAVTAAVAENVNLAGTDPSFFITAILDHRIGAAGEPNDAATLAPALLTAAIAGLNKSAGKLDVLTASNIQKLVAAAAPYVAKNSIEVATAKKAIVPTVVAGSPVFTSTSLLAAALANFNTDLLAPAIKGLPSSMLTGSTAAIIAAGFANVSFTAQVAESTGTVVGTKFVVSGTTVATLTLNMNSQAAAIAASAISKTTINQASVASQVTAAVLAAVPLTNTTALLDFSNTLLKGVPAAVLQQTTDALVASTQTAFDAATARSVFSTVAAAQIPLTRSILAASTSNAESKALLASLVAVDPSKKITDTVRGAIAAGAATSGTTLSLSDVVDTVVASLDATATANNFRNTILQTGSNARIAITGVADAVVVTGSLNGLVTQDNVTIAGDTSYIATTGTSDPKLKTFKTAYDSLLTKQEAVTTASNAWVAAGSPTVSGTSKTSVALTKAIAAVAPAQLAVTTASNAIALPASVDLLPLLSSTISNLHTQRLYLAIDTANAKIVNAALPNLTKTQNLIPAAAQAALGTVITAIASGSNSATIEDAIAAYKGNSTLTTANNGSNTFLTTAAQVDGLVKSAVIAASKATGSAANKQAAIDQLVQSIAANNLVPSYLSGTWDGITLSGTLGSIQNWVSTLAASVAKDPVAIRQLGASFFQTSGSAGITDAAAISYASAISGSSAATLTGSKLTLNATVNANLAAGILTVLSGTDSSVALAATSGTIASLIGSGTNAANGGIYAAAMANAVSSNSAAVENVVKTIVTSLNAVDAKTLSTFAGTVTTATPSQASSVAHAVLSLGGIANQYDKNTIILSIQSKAGTALASAPAITSFVEATFPTTANAQVIYARALVVGANATDYAYQIGQQLTSNGTLPNGSSVVSFLTNAQPAKLGGAATAITAATPAQLATLVGGIAQAQPSLISDLITTVATTKNGAIIAAGLAHAVPTSDTAIVSSVGLLSGSTSAILGAISKSVSATVPTDAGAITSTLLPQLSSFLSGTSSKLKTDAAVDAARITDLAYMAGSTISGLLTTQTNSIQQVINATINGTITTTGTSVALDGLLTGKIAGYTAATAAQTGSVTGAFVQTLLSNNAAAAGVSGTSTLANFTTAVIGSAKANLSGIAQGAANYAYGSYSTTPVQFAGNVASLTAVAAKGATAAGIALAATQQNASTANTAISNVTLTFAVSVTSGSNDKTNLAADTAKITIAKTVAAAAPLAAWEIAQAYVGETAANSVLQTGTTGRASLVTGLISSVVKLLPTVAQTEQVSLIVASASIGLETDHAALAYLIATGIAANPASAYDIMGAVASMSNLSSSDIISLLLPEVTSKLILLKKNTVVIAAEIAQAARDAKNATGHFYKPGQLNRPETDVTGV